MDADEASPKRPRHDTDDAPRQLRARRPRRAAGDVQFLDAAVPTRQRSGVARGTATAHTV